MEEFVHTERGFERERERERGRFEEDFRREEEEGDDEEERERSRFERAQGKRRGESMHTAFTNRERSSEYDRGRGGDAERERR